MANTTKSLMLSGVMVILAAACGGESGEVTIEGVALSQALPEGLTISLARVSFAEVEVEGGTAEDDRDGDVKDVALELGFEGAAVGIVVPEVEVGTYHTLGLELSGILIEGTVRGNAFSFTNTLAPEIKLALEPEIDVPASGSAEISISIDVASWFVAEDSSLLDPSSVDHRSAIEARIIASLMAAQKQ